MARRGVAGAGPLHCREQARTHDDPPENLYRCALQDDGLFQQDYGELFDLQEDPGEVRNLWDAEPNLRAALTQKMLFAEMGKEPLPTPRISGA